MKPPIRALPDKVQDKSKETMGSASDKSRDLHATGTLFFLYKQLDF